MPRNCQLRPLRQTWMIKVEMSDPAELDALLDADAYTKKVEESES